MLPTLHILTNPWGITDLRYRMEPFNIAAHKFVTQMMARGWNIIHYGHELSTVTCQHETIMTQDEIRATGDNDLFLHTDATVSQTYAQRVQPRLRENCRPGDMVLCFYGAGNQDSVRDIPQDVKVIEPAIGYWPETIFAPYRVFTSYAVQHYYYGVHRQLLTPSWFDTVIPNAITPSEFEFSDTKDDYVLYLGRISPDKGIGLAIQATEHTGQRLIIAGTGSLAALGYNQTPVHVEVVGYVDPDARRKLLSRARVLMAPTHYIEPFGNIVPEALMSGTPVITTDWGGFVDTNVQGVTGYRCRDFDGFVRALENIDRISNQRCRAWAMEKFSDSVVHDQFDHHLRKLHRSDFYHVENI